MTPDEINAIIAGLPQPIDLALPGMDEEQAIQVLMAIGISTEEEARMTLALERGEVEGDIEIVP